jgi:CheY-like chemotaxis protein
MMMNEMHGFELVQRIRADAALTRTVIVVMSAKSFKSDIDRARQLGATDYVVKPFKTEELFELVERHLAAATG